MTEKGNLEVSTHVDTYTLKFLDTTPKYTGKFLVSGYEYFAVYIKASNDATLNVNIEYSPFFYGEEWCAKNATGAIVLATGLVANAEWVVLPLNPYSAIWGRLKITVNKATDIEVKIARQIAQ